MLTFYEESDTSSDFSQLDKCWYLAIVFCVIETLNQIVDITNNKSLALKTYIFLTILTLVIWFQHRCSTYLLFQLVYPVTSSYQLTNMLPTILQCFSNMKREVKIRVRRWWPVRNGGCNSFVGLETLDRVLLGVDAGHGTRPTFAASSCGHIGWLRQHAHLRSEC